mgnify:CR=1 FL=1
MNTNNPDILFFVRREYGTPSIELRAYKVEKVNNCLLYTSPSPRD